MEKKIILPGEKIEKSIRGYTYKNGNNFYSNTFGIETKDGDFIKIVPLNGKYIPEEGDYIVGIVQEEKFGGYVIEINSPYTAYLPSKRELKVGDIVFVQVAEVGESILLVDEKKLFDGEVVEILPVKVPRLIGKKNSMLNLIKDKTGCLVFIGKNGRVWIKGEKVDLAKKVIKKVEEEAHTSGLTEKITVFLEGN